MLNRRRSNLLRTSFALLVVMTMIVSSVLPLGVPRVVAAEMEFQSKIPRGSDQSLILESAKVFQEMWVKPEDEIKESNMAPVRVKTLPITAVETNNQKVTIPDQNLESAIRMTLNKPSGDIIVSDMTRLTYLKARHRGIKELTGLEYATNLIYLEGMGNQISDISALSNLNKLGELELSQNQISDISALSNLTELTWLNLSQNQISDISALSNLTELTRLDLSQNQISDISALSNLTELTDLYLYKNQISDISVLMNLKALKKVELRGNLLNLSADSPAFQVIQSLKGRGVEVLYDQQVGDITPPSPPTVNDVTDNDTKLTGTAEAGSMIAVKAGDPKVTLGTAKTGTDGVFVVPIPLQKAGTVLYVTAKDAAGNESEATKVIVKQTEIVKKLTHIVASNGKVKDVKSLAITKGSKLQIVLNAVYEDQTKEDITKMATWKSENPAVALVENGLITTHAQGKTSITAEYKDKRVALTVEVNLKGLVATIDDVVIKKPLSMKPNSEQQIRLKADHGDGKLLDVPAEETKWQSNNPEIASVDEKGLITTTIKPGKTLITAEFGGKKVSIPVEIKLKSFAVTVEGESVKSLNLETGDQVKITLTAIYTDRESTSLDVTNETQWKSSKAAIAVVDPSGNVTALAKGKAVITGKFGGKTVMVIVNVK